MEYENVLQLAKELKAQINNYNVKKITREELTVFVRDIFGNENNRAMIYRGSNFSTTFSKTLSKWRLNILKEIIAEID